MKSLVLEKLQKAIKSAGYAVLSNFSIETPPKAEMGDFATNVAMIIAVKEKKPPREIAEKIAGWLKKEKDIKNVEIAGPGFINIFLSSRLYKDEFKKILTEKEDYGRGKKKKQKVNVEYISANPTGPLHIGNGRGGPIGEALANLFQFSGYEVEREFYINDTGLQIERFGKSLYYYFAKKTDPKVVFPEDGYPGDYIKDISETIQKEKKEELKNLKDEKEIIEFFVKEGLYHTVKSIREDSFLLDIKFDTWAYESDLVFSGKTNKVIEELKQKGFTSSKEGALWFRSPDDPELMDKESVLVKSDGKTVTYFADDIAYHIDKIKRGSKMMINVWGANHHGHLPRFNAAMRAMGISPEKISIVFYQYIRLKKGGKAVSMGKRLGNFVTVKELIESGVSADAFKYFILSQNSNTPFDFDLELAKDTSEKNPVFYIKYAHARICSIIERAKKELKIDERGVEKMIAGADFSLIKDSKETALYKEIFKFPSIVDEVSSNFQVQALPHYAYKIAGLFHDFYGSCKVISGDKKMTATRLSLVLATKYVLKNVLNICGIEAPEKM